MRICKDAANIPEITTVYNELIRVRGEIEMIEGQLRHYDESARCSSVSVELYPPDAEVEAADTDTSSGRWYICCQWRSCSPFQHS